MSFKEVSGKKFWALASLFGFVWSVFIANFFSWGLDPSFFFFFVPLLALSPFLGAAWFQLDAYILQSITRWLGGEVEWSVVRSAIALSKFPYLISLALWVFLFVVQGDLVFVHYATNVSAVFITLVTLVVTLSSLVLLVQFLKEVSSLSWRKVIVSVLMNSLFLFISVLIVIYVMGYVFISL